MYISPNNNIQTKLFAECILTGVKAHPLCYCILSFPIQIRFLNFPSVVTFYEFLFLLMRQCKCPS